MLTLVLLVLFTTVHGGILPDLFDPIAKFGENCWEKATSVDAAETMLKVFLFDGSVTPSDVHTWRNLTKRYVLGLDSTGNPLAIYDLALPNPFSPSSLARMTLGTLGVGDLNVVEMGRQIRNVISNHAGLPDEVQTALNKLDDAISSHGSTNNSVPSRWKAGLKMLGGKIVSDIVALRDIDLAKVIGSGPAKAVTSVMSLFQKYIKKIFGWDLGSNFFNNFKLADSGGGFNIIPDQFPSISNTDITYSKVMDFKDPRVSRARAVAMLILKKVIGTVVDASINKLTGGAAGGAAGDGVGAAPGAVIGWILGSVCRHIIGNFFRLYEDMQDFHRNMIWEHLNTAELGIASPLASLSSDLRGQGGIFVISRNSGLLSQMFASFTPADWKKALSADSNFTKKSSADLTSSGYIVETSFTPFLEIRNNSKSRKLVTLARSDLNFDLLSLRLSSTPHTAVDYDFPSGIRLARNIIEIGYAVTNFIEESPIRTVIQTLWDFTVTASVKNDKRYEQRACSQLLWKTELNQGNWERELNILYGQRLNPFMLDRLGEESLISSRRPMIQDCKTTSCSSVLSACPLDTSTKLDCCDRKCLGVPIGPIGGHFGFANDGSTVSEVQNAASNTTNITKGTAPNSTVLAESGKDQGSTNVGLIVGVTVGCVVGLVIVGIVVFIFVRPTKEIA